jgi:hypothetical protein
MRLLSLVPATLVLAASSLACHADTFSLDITDAPSTTSAVPEPSTLALFGTGILGLTGVARRKFLQP